MLARTTARVVATLLASVCLVGVGFADDSKLKVKVGDPFPDFKLPITKPAGAATADTETSLSSLKGKIVVIAFYPKAKTGG